MRIDASNLIAAQSALRPPTARQPVANPAPEGMSFESLSFRKAAAETQPTPVLSPSQKTPNPGVIPRLGSQLDIKV